MFCPESMLINGRFGYVTRHEGMDVPRRYLPKRIRFNPLRLEIGLGRSRPCAIVINRDGRWNRALSNLTWRLWRRRLWERGETRRKGRIMGDRTRGVRAADDCC